VGGGILGFNYRYPDTIPHSHYKAYIHCYIIAFIPERPMKLTRLTRYMLPQVGIILKSCVF